MRQRTRSMAVKLMVCSCLFAGSARAQGDSAASPPDSARMATARAMVEASGMAEAMVTSMRTALVAQRQATSQLPEEFWTRVEAQMVKDAPQLADSVAGVYAANFSLSELESLVAFYRSPIGQRVRQLQPTLIAQSSAIGQRWGMRIGNEIGSTLKPE
ncbi:MAG: DUF2059 domain-containing protein [Gemmatimonadales bacterium]